MDEGCALYVTSPDVVDTEPETGPFTATDPDFVWILPFTFLHFTLPDVVSMDPATLPAVICADDALMSPPMSPH